MSRSGSNPEGSRLPLRGQVLRGQELALGARPAALQAVAGQIGDVGFEALGGDHRQPVGRGWALPGEGGERREEGGQEQVLHGKPWWKSQLVVWDSCFRCMARAGKVPPTPPGRGEGVRARAFAAQLRPCQENPKSRPWSWTGPARPVTARLRPTPRVPAIRRAEVPLPLRAEECHPSRCPQTLSPTLPGCE